MAGIGRWLALKPYGEELLTRSADFWILSARLVVFSMALAEAIAWGYLGSLMSRNAPLLTAGVVAALVFALIWIIDASLMTLDLSRSSYERAPSGREGDRSKGKLRVATGIAARLAIVTASLFVTAPFLAQAVFAGDIADEIDRHNAEIVATKRLEIETPLASRIAALRESQRSLEQQRVDEAAGIGPSGRYGRGPALETIERQLAETRQQVAAAERAGAAALERFDTLSREQLEGRHGVRLLTPGVQSSGVVLGELLEDRRFGDAELAVRVFLAILFLGLLVLKGFEPRSVAIYFDERLHGLYDAYRKGIFDDFLPPAERSSAGGGIDPLRFADWCLRRYPDLGQEVDARAAAASRLRDHRRRVEQWRYVERTTREDLEPLMQRQEALLAAVDELAAEVEEARASATAAAAELDEAASAHEAMLRHLERDGLEPAAFERAAVAATDLEQRRRDLARRAAEANRRHDLLAARLERRRGEAGILGDEAAAKQRVIDDARRRIDEHRLALSQAMGELG